MKPLEDKSGPYAKLFSPADLSTMFCNIAMIEVMCKDLLKLFEQAASEAPRPADAAVGKAYIAKKIALTASFSAYCANQSKALQLYETLKKKNSTFSAYLVSVRDHPQLRGLGLLDWLIKPVQRVTKYPLLLRELERYTPENHSDRENTVLAAKAVQELVDQVNIAAKQMETTHHMMRISEEVGDIPSSLQLRSSPGRYFVTEGKWIKVSHGKHQERNFWLFSDFIMYARPNVASTKKYTFKGTIVLTKSNYEDLPDGNEYGANAIRITRLDSKKTYIIYCKESKQKAFWLTNINELKDLGSKGTLAPQLPTIGVAQIVSATASPTDFAAANPAEPDKANNSLVMWGVAVRIAGWANEDQSRTLFHECAVKAKPLGKDVDYCFMFSDGWMGTKIKMFKTAQSSKNAVDFKVFIPFELMESFLPKSDTSVEVKYVDPDGGSKNGAFSIEYETAELAQEALKLLPNDQIGKVRESQYTKRISHQSDAPSGITRSNTSASLSLSHSPAVNLRNPNNNIDSPSGFGNSTYGAPSSPGQPQSLNASTASQPVPLNRPHSVRTMGASSPALSSSAPNPHLVKSNAPPAMPGTAYSSNGTNGTVPSPSSSPLAKFTASTGKQGPAPPMPKTAVVSGGPAKAGYSAAPSSMPARVVQTGSTATPKPVSVHSPPTSTSPSHASTSSPGPSSPLAKSSAAAPPMPTIPKTASSTPSSNPSSPPPKGPGKLTAAVKKWPPT